MQKVLQDLINEKITGIQKIHDYWILITDECGINIYNTVKFFFHNDYCELPNLQLNSVLDHVIVGVSYKEADYLNIELENKSCINISLKEKDYIGPEAASIHFSTGETLVI